MINRDSGPATYNMPTPVPREQVPYIPFAEDLYDDKGISAVDKTSKTSNDSVSMRELAESHASRHVTNTKEIIARHEEEIARIEKNLQDYRDAVDILRATLPGNHTGMDVGTRTADE